MVNPGSDAPEAALSRTCVDMQSLFARLAGLRMMVLTGLQDSSASFDLQFLLNRLLIDASQVVGGSRELLDLQNRASRFTTLRDPDQRLSFARDISDDLTAIMAHASDEGLTRSRAHGRRIGPIWVVTGLILVALLVMRVAYTPVFLGRYVFPNHYQRLSDLSALRTALDAYRARTGSFPLSADEGKDWNGVGWKGDPADWVPGLTPSYILRLPVDPRLSENPYNQYVYRSNGSDFKLLSLVPEDCELTVRLEPALSDPARNVYGQCYAYGYWSSGARAW